MTAIAAVRQPIRPSSSVGTAGTATQAAAKDDGGPDMLRIFGGVALGVVVVGTIGAMIGAHMPVGFHPGTSHSASSADDIGTAAEGAFNVGVGLLGSAMDGVAHVMIGGTIGAVGGGIGGGILASR